jgi:hypothetical protein
MGVFKKISSGHGLTGSGSGHPKAAGVTGPGGSFVGTKFGMDDDRNDVSDKGEVGEVGSKKVPAGVGMSAHKTGGMSRKSNSKVGFGGPFKGTK